MPSLHRSLTVPVPPDLVAAYLGELANSTEWDLHTRSCRRLDEPAGGAVRVGATYRHIRFFQGYDVELDVAVAEYEPGRRVAWKAAHAFARGSEWFTFAASGDGGTTVEHGVEVSLRGVARLGGGMVRPIMSRIADEGTEHLRSCLERLGAGQPDAVTGQTEH